MHGCLSCSQSRHSRAQPAPASSSEVLRALELALELLSLLRTISFTATTSPVLRCWAVITRPKLPAPMVAPGLKSLSNWRSCERNGDSSPKMEGAEDKEPRREPSSWRGKLVHEGSGVSPLFELSAGECDRGDLCGDARGESNTGDGHGTASMSGATSLQSKPSLPFSRRSASRSSLACNLSMKSSASITIAEGLRAGGDFRPVGFITIGNFSSSPEGGRSLNEPVGPCRNTLRWTTLDLGVGASSMTRNSS
mmetsp:Transcript_17056/g.46203  ORF Transcript_17056/g.46203 Transcript_17056/m.46203 type:complete len:252 (-) Transcript_17056:897-1652(-)